MEQLSEAHRKGYTPHTADMDVEVSEHSSESDYVDAKAGEARVVKTLNEFVAVLFRELHLGVHNDIMKLKTKGYGPQTFGGRDDPPILREASSGSQKPKAGRDTTVTTTSTDALCVGDQVI
jgi:alpha-acetolactate decarboxylase